MLASAATAQIKRDQQQVLLLFAVNEAHRKQSQTTLPNV
jgi:hypothetical protein